MELEHLLKLFDIACIAGVVILILLAIIVPNLFSIFNVDDLGRDFKRLPLLKTKVSLVNVEILKGKQFVFSLIQTERAYLLLSGKENLILLE